MKSVACCCLCERGVSGNDECLRPYEVADTKMSARPNWNVRHKVTRLSFQIKRRFVTHCIFFFDRTNTFLFKTGRPSTKVGCRCFLIITNILILQKILKLQTVVREQGEERESGEEGRRDNGRWRERATSNSEDNKVCSCRCSCCFFSCLVLLLFRRIF